MAIDDNTDYTLTGAQVKDLAARIKAAGGMTVYVDASFATPSSITGVYSDSALSTPADPDAMADAISAGGTVVVVYDGGQVQEFIELSSVDSNDRFPEIGKTFASTISTSAVFSVPTVVILLYDGTSSTWSVETTDITTVNNGTLTIQHNGTNVQTFTANQATNATANVETIWADPIASTSALTPPVQTNMIADGAVTSAKVDWSTVKAAPVSLTDFADVTTGFSILNGSVWQFSNIVFGNILVKKNSGYYGAQEVALTVKSGFCPAEIWNSYCAMSGSEWGSDYVGYAYAAVNGKIWLNCMSNASCNVAKVRFFWVKA